MPHVEASPLERGINWSPDDNSNGSVGNPAVLNTKPETQTLNPYQYINESTVLHMEGLLTLNNIPLDSLLGKAGMQIRQAEESLSTASDRVIPVSDLRVNAINAFLPLLSTALEDKLPDPTADNNAQIVASWMVRSSPRAIAESALAYLDTQNVTSVSEQNTILNLKRQLQEVLDELTQKEKSKRP